MSHQIIACLCASAFSSCVYKWIAYLWVNLRYIKYCRYIVILHVCHLVSMHSTPKTNVDVAPKDTFKLSSLVLGPPKMWGGANPRSYNDQKKLWHWMRSKNPTSINHSIIQSFTTQNRTTRSFCAKLGPQTKLQLIPTGQSASTWHGNPWSTVNQSSSCTTSGFW